MDDSNSKKTTLDRTFAALKHRNFRLFWTGQCISLIGTWMQTITQSWLVLELTNSALFLGWINVIQFTPMLFLSLFTGTLIDRFSKQKMIIFTQSFMLCLALILAIDITAQTVALWHVFLMAGLLGIVNTLDMPARQAFMVELVGKEDLRNAIILNSTIFNAARIVGPSVAGFIIARLGMSLCFFLNAASFIPVIIGLLLIRLDKTESVSRKPQYTGVFQEITAGVVYVFKTPAILAPVLLMAVINVLTLNFNVLIPIYAKNVFHGDAGTYGLLMSANGIGAFFGSFILAAHSGEKPQARLLAIAACSICIFEILLTPVTLHYLAVPLLISIGYSVIAFSTTTNSLVQFQAPDHLRGRIMSLYAFVFMGLTPIGSFLSGWAAEKWGAPVTMGLGAFSALVISGLIIAGFPGVFRNSPEDRQTFR